MLASVNGTLLAAANSISCSLFNPLPSHHALPGCIMTGGASLLSSAGLLQSESTCACASVRKYYNVCLEVRPMLCVYIYISCIYSSVYGCVCVFTCIRCVMVALIIKKKKGRKRDEETE